ncbi:NmrA family protein [Colletotrichum musicola]|uniref:NmrA family protein n=1 Tax=Colletotrichum musicola TaxID=2175873 RepID=A0A8H6U763_9PEZI|nr:NmrA family protein [Colletotrichum musicola]
MTKLITVYGATGAQGGSVAQALLRDNTNSFSVRGITRDPSTEKARKLSNSGVDVVQADGIDKQSLVAAFSGSWGVFANTNSDDLSIGEEGLPSETDIGRNIVDAAVEAGVQIFVYSGMASPEEITKGAMTAKAFEEKHAIGEHARSKPSLTVVEVSPGWYMENFLDPELAPVFGGLPFEADAEGYMTFRSPRWGGDGEVPLIAVGADYGDLVHGVFLCPVEYRGVRVQGMSQSRGIDLFGDDFQAATGKKARYVHVEDWRFFETYGVRALGTVRDMFGFVQLSGGLYYGEPNDAAIPKVLKAAAAEAQGKTGEEAELMTLEKFFKVHFG